MIDIQLLGKYQQHLLDVQSANYKYNVLINSLDYINAIVKSGEFEFLPISQDVNDIYTNNNYFYNYLESKIFFVDNVVLQLLKNRVVPTFVYKFNSNLDYFIKINNINYIISKNSTLSTHKLLQAKCATIFKDITVDYTSKTLMDDLIEKTGMAFIEIHELISITNTLTNIHYKGYNKLNIGGLLGGIYDPDWRYIIHDELYTNLNNIYSKFFSDISDYSIYSIIYNNFKINTLNPSNYLKVCFDKDYRANELKYKMAYFYILPMYNFSKLIVPQLLTSIKRTISSHISTHLSSQYLKINDIGNIENLLKDFILANIFNNMRFNDYYIMDIRDSIDLTGLITLFNNYVDKLSNNNFSKCLSNLYNEYIQEFAYLLMTYGRENGLIKFNIPEDIYKNSIYAVENVLNNEDNTVIDLLNQEIVPEIFFEYILKNEDSISESNSTVYFLRINNVNYKLLRKFMPETFNNITTRLTAETGYNKLLSDIKLTEQSQDIFKKTKYHLDDLIAEVNNTNFFVPPDVSTTIQKNSIYKTLNQDILRRTNDIRSLVTITYKYRDDPLQFINSNLAAFSDWTNLILDTQYDNIDYIKPLTENDIKIIIGSIEFDTEKLLTFINSDWIGYFIESKLIDLNVYSYIGSLVDDFSKTDQFKKYILKDLIEPTAAVLKTQSPKLYKEIYQNIDNIINYLKYLLVVQTTDTSDLANKYRNLLLANSISNFKNEILLDIISSFRNVDSILMKEYQNDSTKFITSMAVLSFLDDYIDGFRLVKKFGKKSDYFRS
jgi:hypothetical protein